MKLTTFDEKKNTLYINSDAILPDTTGMNFLEHCKKYDEWFAKSYKERIELSPYKELIEEELAKHPDCKISEFLMA